MTDHLDDIVERVAVALSDSSLWGGHYQNGEKWSDYYKPPAKAAIRAVLEWLDEARGAENGRSNLRN